MPALTLLLELPPSPYRESRCSLRSLRSHLPPMASSYKSLFFWIATLVRCMYVLEMSEAAFEYRYVVKRQKPPR